MKPTDIPFGGKEPPKGRSERTQGIIAASPEMAAAVHLVERFTLGGARDDVLAVARIIVEQKCNVRHAVWLHKWANTKPAQKPPCPCGACVVARGEPSA